MGGLAVDVSHLHDCLETVVLTPSGILHLAERGCFFEVSDAEIQDKSKSNSLAKGLVLLQITWTILQCLSRKAAGLPLSILEVHILVHAGCALIMYILWFSKPLDIDEPIMVSSKIPNETIALMLVQNYKFGMPPYRSFVVPGGFQPARLATPRFGVWPSSQASESSLLMFNSQSLGKTDDIGGSCGCAQVQAGDSRHSWHCPKTQLSASYAEATEHQSCPEPTARRVGPQPTTVHPDRSSDTFTTATSASEQVTTSPSSSDQPSVPTASLSTAPGLDNICYGFGAVPWLGVKVRLTLSTGEFLSGGIGPNAYFIGNWTDSWTYRARPQCQQPIEVRQIPRSLQEKVPLPKIDPSTVAYYCSLTLSLSHKDYRRWQLAGNALYQDMAAKGTIDPESTSFMDFNSSGGTLRGAYFDTSSRLVDWSGHLADIVIDNYERVPRNVQQRAVFFWCLYHHLLEVEELKLRSTSAVMMLPGVMYGGLHLTLWNNIFPTAAERLMWRISGVVLIAVPVLVALLLALRAVYQKYTSFKSSEEKEKQNGTTTQPAREKGATLTQETADTPPSHLHDRNRGETTDQEATATAFSVGHLILLDLVLIPGCFVTVVYVSARIFIIVESFISLRHVPVGVYTDVGWSKYIPHF